MALRDKAGGIRDTERKWLSLVNTWLSFAQLAYPACQQQAFESNSFVVRSVNFAP
jgi:hypothetical protein